MVLLDASAGRPVATVVAVTVPFAATEALAVFFTPVGRVITPLPLVALPDAEESDAPVMLVQLPATSLQ